MLQLFYGPEGKRPMSAAFDSYVIADADDPTVDYDRHDSGFHVGMPAAVSRHRSAQPLLEPLDLDARDQSEGVRRRLGSYFCPRRLLGRAALALV